MSQSVPVALVRKAILPHKPDRCVLRDEIGRRYYCDMHWAKRSGSTCSISGGWTEFVKTNDLAQGDCLRMGIELKDCTVIHIEVLQRAERSKNARGSPAVWVRYLSGYIFKFLMNFKLLFFSLGIVGNMEWQLCMLELYYGSVFVIFRLCFQTYLIWDVETKNIHVWKSFRCFILF